MKFNLINNTDYESKIDSSVFEDLEIKTLFDNFFEGNWFDILDVMENLPKKEETLKRQNIFKDILNDNEEIMRSFVRLLEEAIDSYKVYQASQVLIKEYITFASFYKKFLSFIKNGKALIDKLSITAPELLSLKTFLTENYESKTYKTLEEDTIKASEAISKMSNVIVSYHIGDKFMEANPVNNGYLLDDKLIDIASKMNINTSKSLVINNKHDIDSSLYNRLSFSYPEENEILINFYKKYQKATNFDYNELHQNLSFYLKMKTLFKTLENKGICYSMASVNNNKEVTFKGVYDITLYNHVDKVVDNDASWDYEHNIQIISGANGGGKTSFLRSIGVNYLLFSTLGYTISKEAFLWPIKSIYTHFPNDENYHVGYGRLKDELERLNQITCKLNSDSLFLSNETFSSTSEDVAYQYSIDLINLLLEKHVNTIFITHQQKLLNNLDKSRVILLNPIVDEASGNKRLFKIKKVNNEIHSFASDILKKYGLTKEQIKKEDK